MNTKKSLVVVTMLFVCSLVFGAYTSPGWSYGYDLGISRGDNAETAENFAPLGQLRVQLELFDFLYARVGMGFTPLHASKVYSTNTIYGDYRFIFQPYKKARFAPFIYAGTGGSKDLKDSKADIIPHIPMGIGVDTRIKPGLVLEVTAGYNLSNSDMMDGRLRTDDNTNTITGKKQDGFFSLTVGLSHSNPGTQPVKKVVAPAPTPAPTPAPKPVPVVVEAKPTPPPVVVAPTPKVDPATLDSDGDGLSDADEINKYGSDPNKADTDGDGLNDYAEVMQYKTNPLKVDTDGDGLNDYAEVMQYKTNPLNPDTDGEGLNDYAEVMQYKTDPLKSDTDGDGLSDYAEVMEHKTNPLNPDTDGDGLKDGEEVLTHKTNPLDKDTDKGSVDDGKEVAENKNPLDPKDDVMELTTGAKFSLEGILFETAKANILPVSIPILEQAYSALAANPTVNVIIIGHTDSVGNDASNMTLSLNRAESVRKWLVDKGIAANRIKTRGKGETEPRATNDTPEGRAQNRRIEFEIE